VADVVAAQTSSEKVTHQLRNAQLYDVQTEQVASVIPTLLVHKHKSKAVGAKND